MAKFIHHSIVLYLALVVLLRMMAMPLSLLDYSLNREYISTHLCENRSVPDKHCGGTCYVNKQLAKSNESQDSRDLKGSQKNSVVDFFEPISRPVFHGPVVLTRMVSNIFSASLPADFSGNIFHPPIA